MPQDTTIQAPTSVKAGTAREDIAVTVSTSVVQTTSVKISTKALDRQIAVLQDRLAEKQALRDQIASAVIAVPIDAAISVATPIVDSIKS